MSAPSFVNAYAGGPTTSATTWSYTLGTVLDDDVLVQVWAQLGSQAYTFDSGAVLSGNLAAGEVSVWPDGLGSPYTNGTATLQAVVAVVRLAAADSGKQVSTTFGGAQTGKVIGVVLRGASVSQIIDQLARAKRTATSANQSLDPPAVVPGSDDTMLLTFVMARALTSGVTPGDVTPPTGFTEAQDTHNTGASQINAVLEAAYKVLSGQSGVSQDPGAATITNDTARNITITLAIKAGLKGGTFPNLSTGNSASTAATGSKQGKGSFTLSGGGQFQANGSTGGSHLFDETFDGVGFNVDATAANTNYTGGQVVTGTATAKGDSGPGVTIAGNSVVFSSPAGSSISLSRNLDPSESHTRGYWREAANPTGVALTIRRLRVGATTVSQISVATTGFVQLRNGGTVVDTSLTAITLSQFFRWEHFIDRAGGTQELRLWFGANVGGPIGSPDETLTGAYTDVVGTMEERLGPSTVLTNAMTARADEIAGATDWLGPAGLEAHSGTFTLSGGGAIAATGRKTAQSTFSLSTGNSAATAFVGLETDHGNGEITYDSTGTGHGTKAALSAAVVLSGGGGFSGWAATKLLTGRLGSFTESGGGDFDTVEDGAKQGSGAFGNLTTGGRMVGWTGRKGVSKSLGTLSGGGGFSVVGFHSESTTSSINLSGGGGFTVVGKAQHSGSFGTLSGGGAYHVTPSTGHRGIFIDHNGGAFSAWTGVATPAAPINRNGTFRLSGGGTFAVTHIPSHVPTVRLIWTGSIDDHVRPDHPLWGRSRLPATQTALLLFRDGRVIEATTLYSLEADEAEYVVAGGHVSEFPVDAWQVNVLADAGYTLVLTATEGSI